jgi:sodium/proline symporter
MHDRQLATLITLLCYLAAMMAIGFLAQRLTRDRADFFLGGRAVGPWVASFAASAASSSAWTLLGVSGYAFNHGLAALWLFPGCVGGFALNWFVLAPRLRRAAAERGALTMIEMLAGPAGSPGARAVARLASLIVLGSLLVYVAAQFQGGGKTLAAAFDLPDSAGILIGAAVVIGYTLVGGYWAVSMTDTLQGLLMALSAIVLPVTALVAVGGPAALADGLARVPAAGYLSLSDGASGAAALGLVAGLLGIGLGYPGQPHVVVHFMALRDERSVARARRVALTWAAIVYSGMIVLGLSARVLLGDSLADGERAFVAVANELCSPVVAGVMVAALLSAIMSTVDSQLLVVGSTVSHDLGGAAGGRAALRRERLAVFGLSAAAVLAALVGSQEIFAPVLFAWTAMGAAFGPLLLLTVRRGLPPRRVALAAIATGCGFAVAAHLISGIDTGLRDVLERVVPFVLAGTVAAASWRRTASGIRGDDP